MADKPVRPERMKLFSPDLRDDARTISQLGFDSVVPVGQRFVASQTE